MGKDGDLYKVEFELGILEVDHEVWFNRNAEVVRHKEEIERIDLPQPTQLYLRETFKGYRRDDIHRITEGDEFLYCVKVKAPHEVAKLVFDRNGQRIN